MTQMPLSRRTVLACAAASLVPGRALANPFREITWDDLIPSGVPYGEIVGPGVNDHRAAYYRIDPRQGDYAVHAVI